MVDDQLATQLQHLRLENERLRSALQTFEAARTVKSELDLYQAVHTRLMYWARALGIYAVIVLTVIGFTSYKEAKEGALSYFVNTTEPTLVSYFKAEVIPSIERDLRDTSAKETEIITASLTKQFNDQLMALAKSVNVSLPDQASGARPANGYVLSQFLKPAERDLFSITAYRLNVRDTPGGEIIGRQVIGAKVRVVDTKGNWVKIEVVQ